MSGVVTQDLRTRDCSAMFAGGNLVQGAFMGQSLAAELLTMAMHMSNPSDDWFRPQHVIRPYLFDTDAGWIGDDDVMGGRARRSWPRGSWVWIWETIGS